MKPLFYTAMVFFLAGCFDSSSQNEQTRNPEPPEFITGADLSYVDEIERNGGVWRDTQGVEIDPYEYFVQRNAKLLRLRLFHSPQNITDYCGNPITASDLNYVLNASKKIVDAGANLMITLHYGDYFNYPAEQQRPLAWKDQSHSELLDSIYAYTTDVLQQLYDQNTVPYIISIGNEATNGFVDPYAQYDDMEKTNDFEWPEDAEKFNIAFKAVDDFNAKYSLGIKKTIHLVDESVEGNMDDFTDNGVTNFDIIGYSFYPGFSPNTTIAEIGAQVKRLAQGYPDKEIMILETGWQWTESGVDSYENFLDYSNVINYSHTEQGQYDYLMDLKNTLKQNGATGLLYWQPEFVTSTMCDLWGQGSSYEDTTFFNFNDDNKALKAFEFFED